jgi:hypothetical protein
MSALLQLMVKVLIAAGIFWLLWWLIDYFAPPEPFNKILKGIVAIVAVIYLINVLLSLSGTPLLKLP